MTYAPFLLALFGGAVLLFFLGAYRMSYAVGGIASAAVSLAATAALGDMLVSQQAAQLDVWRLIAFALGAAAVGAALFTISREILSRIMWW